ncbi:MAG: SURF1 family protein [Egibacteraceae bacterium]
MYRFLLSPKWIVGHVLVVGLAVTFVLLGFWQLDRHEQRTTRNALVAERIDAPAAELSDLAGLPADDLAYRRVRLSGRYVVDEEVLLTPRARDGRPGHHVLSPLVTDAGDAVIVDRGWVPFELADPPVPQAAPPEGEVRVSGLVFPDEPTARFTPGIRAEGHLTTVSRVDLERLQQQVERPLRPYYVLLQDQDPAGADLPVAADTPELTAGNHLSYAVQWFLFAAVGLVGYPALVRRTALERRDEAAAPDDSRAATGDLSELPAP